MKLEDKKINVVTKLAFLGFFLLIFIFMFLERPSLNWVAKYQTFSVPANSYIGGDARNIKAAADCASKGFDYYHPDPVECSEAINAPKFNYPSIWAKIYGLFNNNSEEFFIKFWVVNALAIALTLLILAYKINFRVFPILLFSPITLLAVERGNIDGITFAITFMPILLTGLIVLWGFAIVFAASLKIYPIFGLTPFMRLKIQSIPRGLLLGAVLAAPIAMGSFLEIRHLLDGTTKGFEYAFGLPSLHYQGVLQGMPLFTNFIIALYLLFILALVFLVAANAKLRNLILVDFEDLNPKEAAILLVSLSIFFFTFLIFTNWAYRLIFLMPAVTIFSKKEGLLFKYAFLCGIFIFWIPTIPFIQRGWELVNIGCFFMAPVCALILTATFSGKKAKAN